MSIEAVTKQQAGFLADLLLKLEELGLDTEQAEYLVFNKSNHRADLARYTSEDLADEVGKAKKAKSNNGVGRLSS